MVKNILLGRLQNKNGGLKMVDIDVSKLVKDGVGISGDPGTEIKKSKKKGVANGEKIVKNIL